MSEWFPERDVYNAAFALVDRKLAGERRAEARKFIYRQRSSRRIQALMTRLESMPDLDLEAAP